MQGMTDSDPRGRFKGCGGDDNLRENGTAFSDRGPFLAARLLAFICPPLEAPLNTSG